MATLKRRMHKRNASGTYDVLHLETESSLVLRPSGKTVEQSLNNIEDFLPKVQDSDTPPETLADSEIVIGQTKMWIGMNNKVVEVVTMASELNIGKINGLTVDQILAKMEAKGWPGSSGSASAGNNYNGLVNGKLIVGETIEFDGMYWNVVHTDYVNKKAYIASTIIITQTKFGSDATYKGSTLATVAMNFQNTLSAGAQNLLVDTTVNGVTSKIFAPSYEQMNSGFSAFTSNDLRICKFNGVAGIYWTSSPNGSSNVYCVYSDGRLYYNGPSNACGFRPFACLAL